MWRMNETRDMCVIASQFVLSEAVQFWCRGSTENKKKSFRLFTSQNTAEMPASVDDGL
jgi:hypothetical protein